MNKRSKFLLLSLTAVFALGMGFNAMAQESPATSTTSALNEQQISANDLGVSDQTLLPDSPFYFFKEWGRSIKMAITFNKVKKAELENKIANEKLVEIRKMSDKGASEEKIKSAIQNYQKSVERIKNATDKIKDTAENNPEVNKFLDKFANQQVLQEKILQKLEKNVPEAVAQKIREAREDHLNRFQQVMTKLEDNKERMAEKISNALQNGDEINSEILDKIKEKMPDEVKQKLETARTQVVNKVIKKINQTGPVGADCPTIATVDPATFCPNGKIQAERDGNGCITGFKCVSPQIACTTEYNPVCGANGKTYGNKCQANAAKITIAYAGECKKECETDADCPQPNCGVNPDPAANCLRLEGKCVVGRCKILNKATNIKNSCVNDSQCAGGLKCWYQVPTSLRQGIPGSASQPGVCSKAVGNIQE